MNRIVLFVSLSLLVTTNSSYAQNLNAPSAITSQELLQSSTQAWLSIPDAQKLDEKFLETQIGKLTQDEKLAPFMKGVRKQFDDWLNEKNVRLGLNVREVEDIRSGEICIAGIMPNQNPGTESVKLGRDSHGLVLLVDVSQNADEAEDLLEKLSKDLKERGATKEPYGDVNGAKVSKWKFSKKSRLKNHRYAYHTMTNGWLLASDNESIFREIVRRLVNIDNVQKGETLAAQPSFQNVMQQIKIEDVAPEVFWYIKPFGYIQLAQAIAREEEELRQTDSDDWSKILKKIGFGAFKAVGGSVKFASGQHEILHRTYVYKPKSAENIKQQRVFDLFEFANKDGKPLTPPLFVPDTVSSFVCGTWNLQLALKNVGYAIDTFVKSEGTFDDTLESVKVDLNVDVVDVVSKFDNEIMVITDNKLPIEQGSERLSICIRLNGDSDYVIDNVIKSWPHQHKVEEYMGRKVVEIDDSIGGEDTELDVEDDPFNYPSDDWDDEEEEEVQEPAFNLFERKFYSTNNDVLFIANDDKNLKTMLRGDVESPLVKSADYLRVADSLAQMTDEAKISFRQYSRLDRALRPNYEMMRAGKMAASDTVLARFLNHLFESQKKTPDAVRRQKLDGSTLPSDFDKDIAPYFGPSGWVLEVSDDGWLFTGVLLEHEEAASQVVKKDESTQRK